MIASSFYVVGGSYPFLIKFALIYSRLYYYLKHHTFFYEINPVSDINLPKKNGGREITRNYNFN